MNIPRPHTLPRGRRALICLFVVLSLAASGAAAWADGSAQTLLKAEDLDAAAFAQWTDGAEQTASLPEEGPRQALWTRDSRTDHRGVTFGESAAPGARHLRVGLKSPVTAGSVIVRGGGRLSVLKADAAYPGDLAREADWTPAERIKGEEISRAEVGRDEFAVWTLPPGTMTRALRFTHTAQASDPDYSGWLGGALLLPERLANIAPQAIAAASARDEEAAKIINEKEEQWTAWDNGKEGAAQPISSERPEWLMLVWPRTVSLAGLEAFWTGFGAADAQIYSGPADKHPREASDADWRTLRSFSGLENGYPVALWPNGLDFGQTITTRAVRLRLTATTTEGHPHLNGNTKSGKRVWLGELMALQPLGNAELKTALLPPGADDSHPPIPVRFRLAEAGWVSLVIEDAGGKRVRNLVAETHFPAGENVAWWDGCDDLGRDLDAARHGLYHIPEQPVAPGEYRVRGLVHKGLELRYEFSIYNAGNPPWETADKAGGWLTNHTPPQAALFVPADKTPEGKPLVYLGSAVSEGGAGLAWVDLDGRKIGGRGWIGGSWTAAPALARDAGPNAAPDVFAYVGSVGAPSANDADKAHGELRLTALTAKGDRPTFKHLFELPAQTENISNGGDVDWTAQLGGIAARDGVLAASLPKLGSGLFFDARDGKELGRLPVGNPRGIAFDAHGRLLTLSGTRLLRFAALTRQPTKLAPPETLVAQGLQDPRGIAIDAAGNFYISDQGESHQVKVFAPDGKFLRAIGHAGAPKPGPYDPLHMNHPHGLAIDEREQLWVTENDFQPKRVSVWTLDGQFVRAFYGPGRYGGGGSLDPQDKTRFYYDGIEFKLDWKTGASVPAAVFSRPAPDDDLRSLRRAGPPETPIYFEGRQYMTNCFNSNPTGGSPMAALWLMKDGVAAPVAALGRAHEWDLLKGETFQSRWPSGVDPKGEAHNNPALFAWSDLNGDARVQPEEIAIVHAEAGGVTVMSDLSFIESRADGNAVRFAPRRFTPQGAPVYDLAAGETLASGAQMPASSGGDQALRGPDGWTVLTVAPQPWARQGFGGVKNGQPLWSYPSLWPGLHASHEAPTPGRPGEVIGSTRLLGGWVAPPPPSDAGPLWCVNGNMGSAYLFTADGLFVAQLFQDSRTGKPWIMPKAERGMPLDDVSLGDENFFPTIAQTSDGMVYLCDGSRTSLVRLDGLENIRRLPSAPLRVSAEDLQNAAAWRVQAEAQRQAARGSGALRVALRKDAPMVDGRLDDWAGADWAVIDRRGIAANFNSDSKPYDVAGAVAIAGDRLYAVFRTQDAALLKNSGEAPDAPFKTGGALDLMIGADPAADPKRQRPVAGDERLLVTQVKGRTLARLYRAVVPGTREPAAFSSPWRTITLDRVEDVSALVSLATHVEKDAEGKTQSAVYEFSVPLAALGLQPAEGQSIKADLGILRGDGFQTHQRVYWNNKATAIIADVPSEAELTPALWGKWMFELAP